MNNNFPQRKKLKSNESNYQMVQKTDEGIMDASRVHDSLYSHWCWALHHCPHVIRQTKTPAYSYPFICANMDKYEDLKRNARTQDARQFAFDQWVFFKSQEQLFNSNAA